nr:hypothetical protein [Mucilaginibacter sp. X5P1]
MGVLLACDRLFKSNMVDNLLIKNLMSRLFKNSFLKENF